MTTVDGSRALLSAGANFSAGDWASFGAEAGLDLLAVAQLNRGIDLGLGVEALANLEGPIRKYLAADLNGQAHAAARVRAQVQIPLDLFDESGFAVRLQAIAEAAAGVQLAIGLSVGDFLALAAQDERIKGAPLQLLNVFLDEFSFQGGVMAKAAASAMAYANVVATGSLIKKGQRKPGFTVAAEAGVGLKAGAGFRVFARFGVDDPRRLIRRSVDVAVNETLKAIASNLPIESLGLLDECAVVLRIGFRCAFEIGEALATQPGSASILALRAVQVAMEELQRHVFESAIRFASHQLRSALASLDFDNAAWNTAQPQRQALAARLQALPEEPFDSNNANRAYWSGVVADALNLAGALQTQGGAALIVEPLAITWCSVQLLMKSVERISVAQARASVIGAPAVGSTVAFSGDLPAAPAALRAHINSILERGGNSVVTQQVAVSYLLKVLSHRIELVIPGSAGLLTTLTGKGKLDDALSVVLSNIGAFVPTADGTLSADTSLAVVQQGLRTYIDGRLQEELAPLIEQATAGQPELRTYMNEVLLATLRTMVGTVLGELRAVQAGGTLERALREMCSALLMRLFGRSLVVVTDVLLTHSLAGLQGQFQSWARHANDAGGAVPVLTGLTGLQRDFVNDLVVETLEVCSQTFAPLPPQRRARVRDLLYQMIDTMPPDAGAGALESLKAAGMVGNAEAALELAQLLGEEIASNFLRFIQALLAHAAQALLVLLTEIIKDIQRAVEAWVDGLKALAQDLVDELVRLRDEIARLEAQIDDAVDGVFAQLSTLLGGFAGHSGSRSAVRTRIKEAFKTRALDALSDVPGYGHLPADVRRGIRSTVRSIVDDVLDADVFESVVDALQQVSGQTAELLDDLRTIEPGDDLAAAIVDLALDRIEAGVRAAFNGTPYIRLSFDAPIIGRINLGRIEIPMDAFASAIRGVIRDLGRFDDALQSATSSLENLLTLEADHAAATYERDTSQALKDESDQLLAESASASIDLQIVSPQSGAQVSSALTVRLRLSSASKAVLQDYGLSHRRLYLWINGAEVDVGSARLLTAPTVKVAGPMMPMGANSAFTPIHPKTATPPATARLQRLARDKRQSIDAEFTNLPGAVIGSGSRPSITPIGQALIGSNLNQPAPLDLEIDVPANLLHQGINTIACVLVPGPRQRRIERAVSFLVTPPRTSPRGKPVMPELRSPVVLNADLREVLASRGVKTPEATQRRMAFRALERAHWSLPRGTLKKSVDESRSSIAQQIEGSANRLRELRQGIADGKLRPTKAKLNEREDMPPNSSEEAR
jgi:hypothetical protein